MKLRRGGRAVAVALERPWSSLVAASLTVLAIDQATKAIVRTLLAPGQLVEVAGPFSIAHVQNPGIAGGSLAGDAVGPALLATLAVFGVLVFIAHVGAARRLVLVGFGLLLGGGLGNLVDRVRLGSVTDFIGRDNSVFNLADVAIFAGTFVVLVSVVALLPQVRQRYQPRSGG